MTKKQYENQLRATVESQDKALQARFEKADSILMKIPATVLEVPPQNSAVIRDTFSMPPDDSALIETLRTTAAKEGRIASKSEIVRAGLHALNVFKGHELVEVLNRLEKVKPGRKT
jgi:hypothetical protein